MTGHDIPHDDELTPEEREAFAALPRERVPPAALEDRVVDALHAQGLLVQRRRLRRVPGWMAAAAAAGLALFASGLAVGQWMGGQNTADVLSAVLEQDAASRAMAVQTAGSAYVRAVARLSEPFEGEDPGAVGPGAEAARVALHAAALELARLSPQDPTLQMVLAVLGRQEPGGDRGDGTTRQTIWF